MCVDNYLYELKNKKNTNLMSYLHDLFPLGFAVNKRNGKLQTRKVIFAFINKKVIFEFMYAFGEVKK